MKILKFLGIQPSEKDTMKVLNIIKICYMYKKYNKYNKIISIIESRFKIHINIPVLFIAFIFV